MVSLGTDTLYLVLRDRFSEVFSLFVNQNFPNVDRRLKVSHRSYTALGRVHRQNGPHSREVWLFFAAKFVVILRISGAQERYGPVAQLVRAHA